MSITYTFPNDIAIAELRGKTVSGGRFTKFRKNGKLVDAVEFPSVLVQGQILFLGVGERPELEALLAAHKAEKAAAEQALVEQYKAHALTPRGQREALVAAEQETYSEHAFPGSARWCANKRAADALREFDAQHPQLAAEIAAEREAERKAYYDQLSDFVKMGS